MPAKSQEGIMLRPGFEPRFSAREAEVLNQITPPELSILILVFV